MIIAWIAVHRVTHTHTHAHTHTYAQFSSDIILNTLGFFVLDFLPKLSKSFGVFNFCDPRFKMMKPVRVLFFLFCFLNCFGSLFFLLVLVLFDIHRAVCYVTCTYGTFSKFIFLPRVGHCRPFLISILGPFLFLEPQELSGFVYGSSLSSFCCCYSFKHG